MALRTSPMDEGEISDILTALKKGKSVKEVAISFGRDESTLFKLIKRLRPTTELARITILSKAAEMANKVVEKADVGQLLDILSRPGVDVLQPAVGAGKGAGGGPPILINIQAGSLAAVNEQEFIEGQKRINPQPDESASNTIQIGPTPLAQVYRDAGEK